LCCLTSWNLDICVDLNLSNRWIVGSSLPTGPCDSVDRPFPGIAVNYRATKKGWITSSLIRDFIKNMDSTMSRGVLLVTSLLTQAEVNGLSLKFVSVLPLSPFEDPDISTPMSRTLLPLFRAHFRLSLLSDMVECMRERRYIQQPSIRLTAERIQNAWRGIRKGTISSAFRSSTVFPRSLTARAASLGQRDIVYRNAVRAAVDSIAAVTDDLQKQLLLYRGHVLGGYMFSRELGLYDRLPPHGASATRLLRMPGEERFVYDDASDVELVMAVSPVTEEAATDEQKSAPTAGGLVSTTANGIGMDPGSGPGVHCDVPWPGSESALKGGIELTSREDARHAIEKVLAFCREDSVLHTEEVIYMCSALQLELSRVIKEADEATAASGDVAGK
jgi:DDE superfamily endonuclease